MAASYKIKIAVATKHKNDTTALVDAQKIQEAAIIKKYDDAAKATEEASRAANIAKIDAYNVQLAELTDTEEQKLYDKYAKKFGSPHIIHVHAYEAGLAAIYLKEKYQNHYL